MNFYKENNCRICKKVFCCKKCREKHEMLTHKIFVKCDICVYGKTFLTDPPEDLPEDLISHIKSRHWPLHCILCKRFFGTWEEFFKKSNCYIEYKNKDIPKIAYTPIQNASEDKYESPFYFPKEQLATGNACMFSNLATSTPLQREENNSSEKNNPELVTPVDLSDINKGKKYFSECVSLQRKVTFYETPVMEQENVKKTDRLENRIIVTPCSENGSVLFYSAKYLQENLVETYEKRVSITAVEDNPNIINKKPEVRPEDGTLWISAMNTPSPAAPMKHDEQLVAKNTATPFIAKLKKRQVNVVMPTAIKKNDVDLDVFHSTSTENIPILLQVPPRTDFFVNNNVESNISSIKTRSTNEVLSETSINAPQRLWTSVSRLVRNVTNVVQEFSNVTYTFKTPLKRSISEDNSTDGPNVKRYKLTEIKCRRPIRDLSTSKYSIEYDEKMRHTSNNITFGIKKTFIDKATQTD